MARRPFSDRVDWRLIILGAVLDFVLLPWWVYPVACVPCAVRAERESSPTAANSKVGSPQTVTDHRAAPQGAVVIPSSRNVATPGQIVLNVPSLVGKSPAQVRRVLGSPEKSTREGPSPEWHVILLRNTYARGTVEIDFLHGKTVAIQYNFNIGTNAPYGPESLSHLGLPTHFPPTVSNSLSIVWKSIPGYYAVHVFPGERLPDGRLGLFYALVEIEEVR